MQHSVLGRFCLAKLDAMIDVVARMDDRDANSFPELPDANTAYQLLTHCLGMLREWSQTAILGRAIERNRPAEFTAEGPVRELIAYAAQVRAEFLASLAEIRPDMEVVGRTGWNDFWANSAEGILLHVFEELCQHLGHLEITSDLITSRGSQTKRSR